MKRRIRRFLLLSWKDRFFLCEAAVLLALARIALSIVPFRYVMASCGSWKAVDLQNAAAAAHEPVIVCVAWAVNTVSRYIPWRSDCLVQALAAVHMLRRRHVPTCLYLGLNKHKPDSLSAHAWLRSGDAMVIGGPGHEEFTVVATFAQS